MEISKSDYVKVVYNELDRPFTSYPDKLTRYLFDKYKIKKNSKLIDLGCGRGEFINGFINCGIEGYAVDRSSACKEYYPKINLSLANLETDKIAYPDNYFDVVFSKSVIEHLYYPEKLFEEIYRILKPGGMVITMCPSWEFNMKNYFEDHTHRTPFMLVSLKDLLMMSRFKNIECKYFIQLPILCRYPYLFFLSKLTRIFCPDFLKKQSKWVRFSKEVMLLSIAYKSD